LRLYAEENFDRGALRVERAYQFSPSYKILYSLALIQRHQNNYATALSNFRRYLGEGGDAIPAERRAEVEKEIAVLVPRCATIDVKANVDGADVFVDDAGACSATALGTCIGKTPIPAASS